jgi:hypothetical protein
MASIMNPIRIDEGLSAQPGARGQSHRPARRARSPWSTHAWANAATRQRDRRYFADALIILAALVTVL